MLTAIVQKRAHAPPFFLMFSDSAWQGLTEKSWFVNLLWANKKFDVRLEPP